MRLLVLVFALAVPFAPSACAGEPPLWIEDGLVGEWESRQRIEGFDWTISMTLGPDGSYTLRRETTDGRLEARDGGWTLRSAATGKTRSGEYEVRVNELRILRLETAMAWHRVPGSPPPVLQRVPGPAGVLQGDWVAGASDGGFAWRTRLIVKQDGSYRLIAEGRDPRFSARDGRWALLYPGGRAESGTYVRTGERLDLRRDGARTLWVRRQAQEAARVRRAALAGDAAAQYQLGSLYRRGVGVPADPGEAVYWYQLASDQGSSQASFELGEMFGKALGVDGDEVRSLKFYARAARQGLDAAKRHLEQALAGARKLAEEGDAEAQATLGTHFQEGAGVAQDEAEALRWYRKAADHGHPRALFAAGLLYWSGRGVPPDEAEGVRWFRKAAERSYPPALHALGVAHAIGSGAPLDLTEAFRLYVAAAEKGYAPGMASRGLALLSGAGVDRDEAQGLEWLRKAVGRGDATAQAMLGFTYVSGLGVPRDPAEALRWTRLAAAQGNTLAQRRMGELHEEGFGVPRDVSRAIEWYRKAAAQGDPAAMRKVEALDPKR
jgi:TPR repeat protein